MRTIKKALLFTTSVVLAGCGKPATDATSDTMIVGGTRVSTADAAVQALGPDPEQAFWNEISQIIMLDAPAPAGPVPSSPPLERP